MDIAIEAQEYQVGKEYEIPIDMLRVNEEVQPRKHFDEASIEGLAESVEKTGLIEPVLFRVREDGQLELVAGERRLRAFKKLHRSTITARLTKGNPHEIALIENLAREALTAIDEAQAIQSLIDAHGYKQKEAASVVGKDEATVSQALSINRIDKTLLDDIRTNNPTCTKWILTEIAKEPKPKKQRSLYDRYINKGMSRNEFRKGAGKNAHAKPISLVKKLTKALGSLDLASWDEGELAELKTTLDALLTAAQRVLHPEEEA